MTEREYCRGCDSPTAPHPAYPDCPHCRGTGHVIGGDEYRPCSRCVLQGRAEERAS